MKLCSRKFARISPKLWPRITPGWSVAYNSELVKNPPKTWWDLCKPEFGKGNTRIDTEIGDSRHTPNPCLAPLESGPFYAMKLIPGDIGTFLGLRVDGHARVLDSQGAPIRGLYAAGNDMTSVMGGTYPGAGITIGPALTFGYIAARHAAAEAAR